VTKYAQLPLLLMDLTGCLFVIPSVKDPRVGHQELAMVAVVLE
jgi:hypothetical protein